MQTDDNGESDFLKLIEVILKSDGSERNETYERHDWELCGMIKEI